MVVINRKEEINKNEKKNIVYITYGSLASNFYSGIENCSFCKLFFKSGLNNLSLESYDAYIISIKVFYFEEKKVTKLLEEIYSFNKPVIIVYNSEYQQDFEGIKYLKSKFGINLEMKDASIIENSYEGYLPDRKNDYGLSMISNSGFGKAYIKNSKNCFILRFGNISIIHDSELEFIGSNRRVVKSLSTLLLNLLEIPECEEEPEWIKEIKILDDIEIENRVNDIDKEIQRLNDERKKEEEKQKLNSEYKKALYAGNDELVKVVQKILYEMLNIPINDLDIKKEDLSFELESKKVLVEIKGVNTSIKREHVSQIQRHIEDDAGKNNIDDDDISEKYKGLLIINPYIKTPVKEKTKKEFYSKAVKGDIEHYDICAIDTITLLSLFQKYKNGEKINFKDIILNNNYNEPDFSVIE